MHKQAACCMQKPVPASCNCFVTHAPVSVVPTESEAVKSSDPASTAKDDEAIKAAEAGTGRTRSKPKPAVPFVSLENADIGADIMQKIDDLEDLTKEAEALKDKAATSKLDWVHAEKRHAAHKAEIEFLKEQIPALEHDIGMVRDQLSDASLQKADEEHQVAKDTTVNQVDARDVEQMKARVAKLDEDAASAQRRVKRAKERVATKPFVKEAVKAKEAAKSADAKVVTVLHKAKNKEKKAATELKKAEKKKLDIKAKVKTDQQSVISKSKAEIKGNKKEEKMEEKAKDMKAVAASRKAKADDAKTK